MSGIVLNPAIIGGMKLMRYLGQNAGYGPGMAIKKHGPGGRAAQIKG
jgi:hypothetical protein